MIVCKNCKYERKKGIYLNPCPQKTDACLESEIALVKRQRDDLLAENAKLNIILYHRENGLSHPDLQGEIDKSKFAELKAVTDDLLAACERALTSISLSKQTRKDIEQAIAKAEKEG